LTILPALAGTVVVPPAVVQELEEGIKLGVNLPNLASLSWLTVEGPASSAAIPLVADLGEGETQVLMLALEAPGSIVILDDGLARRVAMLRNIPLTGTLGLLLNAKQVGLVAQLEPLINRLQVSGFRVSASTRRLILEKAGEI
jgi:predicted nucleic acid-binding protein